MAGPTVGEVGQGGMAAPSAWRLPALDVLRGLAATWVVLYHMMYLATPNMTPPGPLSAIIKSGGMGVALFFVVSAFSLCISASRHGAEPATFFYLRRLFRIAPLFYVVVAVTLIRDRLVFGASHSYAEVVSSLLFVYNFIPGWQTGIAWASWTIGVEMAFYLIFPLLWREEVTLLEAVRRSLLAVALCLVVNAVAAHFATGAEFWQWSIFRHLPAFMGGIVTYAACRSARRRLAPATAAQAGRTLLALGLCILALLLYGTLPVPFASVYWQLVVFAPMTAGAALCFPGRIFTAPPLLWMGRNSYSIYLLHPLVIVALLPLYARVRAWSASEPAAFLAAAAITLTAVFAASEVTWRLIEAPGIAAGSRLLRRLIAVRTRMAPAAPLGSMHA